MKNFVGTQYVYIDGSGTIKTSSKPFNRINNALITLNNSEIYSGIDTIQVSSDEESKLEVIKPYVNSYPSKALNNGKWLYRLNPDKANNNFSIYHYSVYNKIRDSMIKELCLKNPTLARVDFRFDIFDNNTYNKLWKLNSALIGLIEQEYKIKNRYMSVDHLTCERLTLRAQTQYFQLEYYHKKIQEPDGLVETRLELRSCKITDSVNELTEFEKWCDRLQKAVTKTNYELLQSEKNKHLIDRFKEEQSQYKSMTVSEFLTKYKDNIFTLSQLTDFYSKLDYKAPKQSASKYKTTKGFEIINFKLLQNYVDKIIESGKRFFES